jgi:hypothetical protein
VEPEPEPYVEPDPVPVRYGVTPPADEPVPPPVAVTEPEEKPSFEEVISKAFTPPRDPDFEVVLRARGSEVVETEVDGTLQWPSSAPLESVPDLVWPTETGAGASGELVWPSESEGGEPVAEMDVQFEMELPSAAPAPDEADLEWPSAQHDEPMDTEFMSERIGQPSAPSPFVRDIGSGTATTSAPWRIGEVPDLPPAMPEARPVHPVPPRADRPPVAPPVEALPEREAVPPAPPRALQRRQSRRLFTLRKVATVVLLAVLALAVALVLAQSAGLIHVGIFGSPA